MKKLLLVLMLGALVVGCGKQGGNSRKDGGSHADKFKVESNWTQVHESQEGRTFTDNAELDKANHRGRFLIQLPTAEDGSSGYTIKATYEANCSRKQIHRITGETFGPQGDSFGKMPDKGWEPVRSNTSSEAIYSQLCGR